jgi:hypothetical protein
VLLNGAARDLPISVLEFNAIAVLDAGRSKSPLMQHVHVQFMALPEVQSMGAAGLVRHRYGFGKPCGDAASVAPVRLDVPARAKELLESTLMAAAALALAEPPVRREKNRPPRVPPPQSRAARGAAHVTQVMQTGAECSHNSMGDGPSFVAATHGLSMSTVTDDMMNVFSAATHTLF